MSFDDSSISFLIILLHSLSPFPLSIPSSPNTPPMISPHREVKNTLSAYQKALDDKLPHSKGKDSFGDECIKFKKEKDRDYVCYCINTAAYIADMLPQLEQMAKNLADEKVRDNIDLQTEVMDNYFNTVSYGIKALVNGEYGKVEGILYSMTSVNWATFEDIGDQSSMDRFNQCNY